MAEYNEFAAYLSDHDMCPDPDPVLPALSTDDPIHGLNLNKATAGNKLPLQIMRDDFTNQILGTAEIIDSSGLLVEKTFTAAPAPAQKPVLAKTAQGQAIFDSIGDEWRKRAFRAVSAEYRNHGDLTAAMRETLNLFVDKCIGSESGTLRDAVAAKDLTTFLKVLGPVIQRSAI